ncbi:MAG: hypothetical protein QG621_253 [Patescibacteria group bacterium]|nr:hypothetical protein [Patescibacteria group bacterium]
MVCTVAHARHYYMKASKNMQILKHFSMVLGNPWATNGQALYVQIQKTLNLQSRFSKTFCSGGPPSPKLRMDAVGLA